MPDNDLDYFQQRAETELKMAQQSDTAEATAAHYKLADDYLTRVEALRASAATQKSGPDEETSAT